jgi:hypothetical protein
MAHPCRTEGHDYQPLAGAAYRRAVRSFRFRYLRSDSTGRYTLLACTRCGRRERRDNWTRIEDRVEGYTPPAHGENGGFRIVTDEAGNWLYVEVLPVG